MSDLSTRILYNLNNNNNNNKLLNQNTSIYTADDENFNRFKNGTG